ncbi:MAG TPA: flippase [Pseudidiomarina sp.]|nr:flippase [Pseudidiomarina sp.]
MIKAALKNSSWLVSEKFVTMGLNLFVTVWLARQLGVQVYGELAYVLALVTLVTPLAALGLNALITRELVEREDDEPRIMATASVVRLLGALVGFAALLLWLQFTTTVSANEQLAIVIIGAVSILQAFQVVEYYFQAKVSAHYVVKMRTLVTACAGIAKVMVAWFSADLLSVAMVYAAEFLLWGLGYIFIYQNQARGFHFKALDWHYAGQLLKQSSWLIFSGVAAVLYLKVDQVMLGHMVSKSEVGVYAVAVKMSEVWYFFATALVTSFFAMLLTLRKEQSPLYARRLQQLCDALFGLAFVLAIAVSLLAEPIIPWLFGEDYRASAAILTIHIWASVFIYMRALASKWLIAERLLAFSLVSHGLGAVVNVAANLWLIPLYQGLGAALATVISYAVASYLAFWVSSSTRPLAMVMTRSLYLPLTLGYRHWHLFKRKRA